ncbi:MAG: hypothetical protein KAJ42_02060, partial [Gemmatimonadetes bacterium]|nr:hypothetical protein [Gemmatimonadota bacterium]
MTASRLLTVPFRALLALVLISLAPAPGDLTAQTFREELPTPYLSGYARTLKGEELTYHSPIPTVDKSLLVRAEDRERSISWETAPVPDGYAEGTATFVVMAAIDVHESPLRWDLRVNGRDVMQFRNPLTAEAGGTIRWEGQDSVVADFRVTMIDKYGDAMGYLYLHLPAGLWEAGEPVRLDVLGESVGRRTWFMIFKEPMVQRVDLRNAPAVLRTEEGEVQIIRMDVLDLQGGTPFRMSSSLVEVDSTLTLGLTRFSLPVPAVEAVTPTPLDFTFGEHQRSASYGVEPVRRMTVHLLHHSHVDIGYTHVQDEVERMHWEYVEEALRLGAASDTLPEEARFVWNLETVWPIDTYLESHPERTEAVVEGIRRGWIEPGGLYGNLLTGIASSEGLLRAFDASRRLATRTGSPGRTEMLSDIPGFTWGLVPALSMHGIRYLSIGPNFGHRIGHLTEELGDRPFYWESPSGKDRVLTWVSGGGYAWFHTGLGYDQITARLDDEGVFRYVEQLDETGYPYDIVYLRYNIGSDNGPPDPGLSKAVADWNARYASPRVIISGATSFFKEFEAQHGKELPTLRGDLTGYWEDGAASSARETALVRRAAETLVQIEALAAIRGISLSQKILNEAWRNVILFYEHTWGSWNSVSEPQAELTLRQWERKKAFADSAVAWTLQLQRAVPASGWTPDGAAGRIDVHNTLNWPRTDLVTLPPEMSRGGDRVRDDTGAFVPSQRLGTGELAFLARDIPPLGSRRFRVVGGSAPGAQPSIESSPSEAGAVPRIETSELTLVVDPGTGTITSLVPRESGRELVSRSGDDTAGSPLGPGLNEYLYVAGRYPESATGATPLDVIWKDRGPLVFSLRSMARAPGLNASMLSEVQVVEGLERVDVVNVFDKALVHEPEAVFFRFPFALEEPEVRIDVPWGSFRPEKDQLPGASKNYYSLQRWVDLHDRQGGVTVVSIDAPLLQLGEIRTDAIVTGWLDQAEPSGTLLSYVMNNYWETNYRAAQDGIHQVEYSLRPHDGFDEAEAERFALERAQPLVAIATHPWEVHTRAPFKIDGRRVVVTALKRAEDGRGYLVRLYNPGRVQDTVRITGFGG